VLTQFFFSHSQKTLKTKQRDGCPKVINLGVAKTDAYFERKRRAGGGGGGGRTALAVALKIRSVPLFHVYRGRELVASFATRDR
jgi:hypothetical protein